MAIATIDPNLPFKRAAKEKREKKKQYSKSIADNIFDRMNLGKLNKIDEDQIKEDEVDIDEKTPNKNQIVDANQSVDQTLFT